MAINNRRQIPKEFQGVNLEALTSELHNIVLIHIIISQKFEFDFTK